MKKLFNLIILLTCSTIAMSQCKNKIYSFTNPTRYTNVNNNGVGTIFRFLNIDSGVNAFITITKMQNATLQNTGAIDITTTGYNQAWQPEIRFTNNRNTAADSSYIEFKIQFRQSGNGDSIKNNLVTVSCLKATIIDCDGTNNYSEMYKVSKPSTINGSLNSLLNVSYDTLWSTVIAPKINNNGIDSAWSYGMGEINLKDTHSFTIRIGAAGSVTSGLVRQFSLYFKQFAQLYVPLSVKDNKKKLINSIVPNVGIYPLPVTDETIIKYDNVSGDNNVTVKVISINGQTIYSENYNVVDNINTLELKNELLISGLYVVQIWCNGELKNQSTINK